jgi:hypothetical protein
MSIQASKSGHPYIGFEGGTIAHFDRRTASVAATVAVAASPSMDPQIYLYHIYVYISER